MIKFFLSHSDWRWFCIPVYFFYFSIIHSHFWEIRSYDRQSMKPMHHDACDHQSLAWLHHWLLLCFVIALACKLDFQFTLSFILMMQYCLVYKFWSWWSQNALFFVVKCPVCRMYQELIPAYSVGTPLPKHQIRPSRWVIIGPKCIEQKVFCNTLYISILEGL